MKNGEKLRLVFGLVRRVSPGYVFLLLGSALTYSGQLLSGVVLLKYLVDELTGAQRPALLALWAAAIAGGNGLFFLLRAAFKRASDLRELDIRWQMERVFAQKVMSVGYGRLEDPHFLDLKERASFAMTNQSAVTNLVSSALEALKQLAAVLSLTAVMLRLSWVLVAILLAGVGATLLQGPERHAAQHEIPAAVLPDRDGHREVHGPAARGL
jgi:hypothetical protein